MTKFATGEVLADIKQQLDWRGPTGKQMDHIVMGRSAAEFLHARVLELINQQNVHVAQIDKLRAEIELVSK